MKSIFHTLLFTTLCAFVASCGNDTQLLTPNPDENAGPFSYKVNGLRDTAMERIGEVKYFILVEKTGGKSEPVTLSAEDLPKGMEVRYEPVNGEMPSFNTMLVIKSVRVKEGVHTIRIKGASPTTRISYSNLNVTIKPYTNAAVGLVGEFDENGKCSPYGPINEKVNIVAHESIPNRVILKGLFSGVMTNEIYADINPSNNTIVIPTQIQNFVTYKGEGTFDDDKVVLNYTITGTIVNENCSTTLSRK